MVLLAGFTNTAGNVFAAGVRIVAIQLRLCRCRRLLTFCSFCALQHLSIASVKGYCAMRSSVIKYVLPGLKNTFILRDLVRSFELERPRRPPGPPVWDLVQVLLFLRGPTFDLCHLVSFGS